MRKTIDIKQIDSEIIIEDIDMDGEIMFEITTMDEDKFLFWLMQEHLPTLKKHIDYLYEKYVNSTTSK